MAVEVTILFLVHSLGWFCLAALVALVRGQSSIMKISSAVGMGVFSSILHVLLRELGKRHF